MSREGIETRQERRERKLEKKRKRVPKHGKNLAKVYEPRRYRDETGTPREEAREEAEAGAQAREEPGEGICGRCSEEVENEKVKSVWSLWSNVESE